MSGKLFENMTDQEKLNHTNDCCARALFELKKRGETLADILDVWDYWLPWLFNKAERCINGVCDVKGEFSKKKFKCRNTH